MRMPIRSMFGLLSLFVLAACGNPGPGKTAVLFQEALIAGDVQLAWSYMSTEVNVMGAEKVKSMLQASINEARRNNEIPINPKFKVIKETITGSTAKVTVRLSSDNRDDSEAEFDLVKEGEVWKVSFDMSSK